jgi:hypothetical protein
VLADAAVVAEGEGAKPGATRGPPIGGREHDRDDPETEEPLGTGGEHRGRAAFVGKGTDYLVM